MDSSVTRNHTFCHHEKHHWERLNYYNRGMTSEMAEEPPRCPTGTVSVSGAIPRGGGCLAEEKCSHLRRNAPRLRRNTSWPEETCVPSEEMCSLDWALVPSGLPFESPAEAAAAALAGRLSRGPSLQPKADGLDNGGKTSHPEGPPPAPGCPPPTACLGRAGGPGRAAGSWVKEQGIVLSLGEEEGQRQSSAEGRLPSSGPSPSGNRGGGC